MGGSATYFAKKCILLHKSESFGRFLADSAKYVVNLQLSGMFSLI